MGLTDYLAIYGALLSSFIGIISAYQYFRSQQFIKLDHNVHYDDDHVFYRVKIMNRGSFPVTIFSVMFGTFNHNKLGMRTNDSFLSGPDKMGGQTFPLTIGPGDGLEFDYSFFNIFTISEPKEWNSRDRFFIFIEHSQSKKPYIERLQAPENWKDEIAAQSP